MSSDKIEREKETIHTMISIYCRGKHHQTELCDKCRSLLLYAQQRLSNCRFAPDKPFCKNCTVHCYKPDKRQQIREVMRYAGPRIFFYYPLLTLKHLSQGIKTNLKLIFQHA